MGFTVQRNEFVSMMGTSGYPGEFGLGQSLMSDLGQTGGMTKIHPSSAITGDTTVAVFESNAAMDPLADQNQKWRLRVEVAAGTVRINVGTVLQIPSDGTGVAVFKQDMTSGHLTGLRGSNYTSQSAFPFLDQSYFYPNQDQEPGSAPLSYRLSVGSHGVAFCAWKNAYDDAGDMFAWFVIQRPVDPATGDVLIDYYSPVFCVYSTGGGGAATNGSITEQGIKKFVVREGDVYAPTESVSAVVPSEDSNAIINPMRQVSISVDNKYMVTFPSGLNTQRRAYKHELDMIAYTSSDVIAQDSDVNVTVFGEVEPRTYKAMQANGKYNTGMRILMLTKGAGVDPANAPTVPEAT